jgi:hypothetical protein
LASLTYINKGRKEYFHSIIIYIFLFVFVFLERFVGVHEFMRKPLEKLWKGKKMFWFRVSLVTRVFSCGGDVGDDDQTYSFTHLYSHL